MKLFGKKRREQGDVAEHQAKCHLKAHGLRTVEQNVRSRFGKVELIMRHGPVRVFVEMRFRRSVAFGGALASVDAKKQRRLIATAHSYLQQHPYDGPCRFDVVGIGKEINGIEWLQNAFELSE